MILHYITKPHTSTYISDKIFTLLKVLPIKHNLILKSGISFRLFLLLNILLHTSQQYGRSPLCTHWCNFTLHMSLNVIQNDTHHILYQKTCVLYQIPLSTTNSLLWCVNNTCTKCPISCHNTPHQNDVW